VIGKVTRGKSIGGLLRYLFGPGQANEHTSPRLVASWLGDDPAALDALEPVVVNGRHDVAPLSGRLALPIQLRPGAVDRPVWQCSMRVADGDRRLTDAEWATVARDVVERTGFAPAGDPGGCRWVAMRHADDHIHIAVVLARQDGARVEVFRDWPKVHAAARAAEQRFGLQVVASPDRTATVAPTRAEVEKASRTSARTAAGVTAMPVGRTADSTATRTTSPPVMPARAWLTRRVRAAAAGSVSREEFEQALQAAGITVTWRESQRTPGQLTGYAVGRAGDVDTAGRQVLFGGSKLSPDLSLPKLRARWTEVAAANGRPRVPRQRDPLTPTQRRQVLDRAERALRRAAESPVDATTSTAASEVTTSIASLVEDMDGGPLTEVAEEFSQTVRRPRGVRPPAAHRAHALRGVASQLSLLGYLLPGEARYALLLLAHVARIAATISADSPAGPRLVTASIAALHQPSKDGQERLRPPAPMSGQPWAGAPAQVERDARAWVRAALPPKVARAVLDDDVWPLLVVELSAEPSIAAERLRTAIDCRELESARYPAAVIHHRLVLDPRSGQRVVWRAARRLRARLDINAQKASVSTRSRRHQ
jgi:hypothetical protein